MDDTTMISAVRNDHPGCQGSQMRFQALHVANTPVTLSPNEHESDRIGRNANSA